MRRFPLSLMSVRRRGSVSGVARRSRRLDIGYGSGDVGMEPLEARVLLTGPAALMTPLPDISLLESSSNPVVRFQTNFGVIDMELFPDTAPGSLRTFLIMCIGATLTSRSSTGLCRTLCCRAAGPVQGADGGRYTDSDAGPCAERVQAFEPAVDGSDGASWEPAQQRDEPVVHQPC